MKYGIIFIIILAVIMATGCSRKENAELNAQEARIAELTAQLEALYAELTDETEAEETGERSRGRRGNREEILAEINELQNELDTARTGGAQTTTQTTAVTQPQQEAAGIVTQPLRQQDVGGFAPLGSAEPPLQESTVSGFTNYGVFSENNGHIIIHDGVTRMGQLYMNRTTYHIINPQSITRITLPDGLEEIGEMAIWRLPNLTDINIPDSVKTIGRQAFYECYRLSSLWIPDSVTYIGQQAFAACHGLTSIIIPESVTVVGEFAFGNCSNLRNLVFLANTEYISQEFLQCPIEYITFGKDDYKFYSNSFPNGESLLEAYAAGGAGYYVRRGDTWRKQ